MNVSYHLQAHGLKAHLIFAVGRDELGDKLAAYMWGQGICAEGIARNAMRPTGTVQVTVDAAGDARYEILADVAWDEIPCDSSLPIAARATALVFGSLAQRSPYNQRSFDHLLRALPPESSRVFDVNLRAPHDELPDSFLVVLLAGLIARHDDARVLAHACRIGEWVATQSGAMPAYDAARTLDALAIGTPATGENARSC